MASRGRGARQKGAAFERKIAAILTKFTGFDFERGLGQTRAGGTEVADVTCDELKDSIHIECKCQKRVNTRAAYLQASNDAPNKTKIVIFKNDREPEMILMSLEEFLPMFKAYVDKLK